ncbi:MAG: AAA family ATPase [Candidatus Omnitrophica bacterium]|nr:AAA family ATPase [Candidatus Omnitrophota bacterium]
MGKIIGICNQKGGTAKTTTAINLSAYLGLEDQKTLLIDMDPQGNATSGVGVEAEGKNSIYDVISGKVPIEESIYPTQYNKLDIIPSNISLSGGEIELVNIPGRELLLREALEPIKDSFSFIVIDAPPSLGLLTVNILTASDSIIVPIQCEYYALEGVSKLVNTVELVQKRLNPNLEIEGILLTMADFRTRLTLQVIEEVRRYFQQKVFAVIVPRNVKLAEAPSFGKPISSYDKTCVGSQSYLKVSQEVIKNNITSGQLAKERS